MVTKRAGTLWGKKKISSQLSGYIDKSRKTHTHTLYIHSHVNVWTDRQMQINR